MSRIGSTSTRSMTFTEPALSRRASRCSSGDVLLVDARQRERLGSSAIVDASRDDRAVCAHQKPHRSAFVSDLGRLLRVLVCSDARARAQFAQRHRDARTNISLKRSFAACEIPAPAARRAAADRRRGRAAALADRRAARRGRGGAETQRRAPPLDPRARVPRRARPAGPGRRAGVACSSSASAPSARPHRTSAAVAAFIVMTAPPINPSRDRRQDRGRSACRTTSMRIASYDMRATVSPDGRDDRELSGAIPRRPGCPRCRQARRSSTPATTRRRAS